MAERSDLDVTRGTRSAYAVTPNDSVLLEPPARALYIGQSGAIRVTHVDDDDPTDYPVTIAGYLYPWAVKRVHSTGTTAMSIVAQL